MFKKLYKYRFELFLVIQLTVLFGSLFFPDIFFENYLLPILYLINIAAGILMISKRKKLMWFCIALFFVAIAIFGLDMVSEENDENILIRLSIYFVFYIIVSWNIIQQVWQAKKVTKNVIMGLISGYISLGFLAFFLFTSIQLTHSDAFIGPFTEVDSISFERDSLLYFAYITLLTIGYGDILPAIPIAQKATVLIGLVGQFYMVIITAVVIEKYIRHSEKK